MASSLPRLVGLEEHWLSPKFQSSDFHFACAGSTLPRECKAANDELHQAVLANPDRFAGFAVLPVNDSDGCAKELKRCVQELGFKGALIDNQTANGTYFTGPEYDQMWQVFQDSDLPCYLHPTWPAEGQMKANFADENIREPGIYQLSTSTWGWHADVASHIIKLFSTGVFDRFPKLKVIVGHFGEMLPFMLGRIDAFSRRWKKSGRMFIEIYRENLWITTSGVWNIDPMATILRNTSIDHILFSVDYPLAPNENGKRWMQELIASGLVDKDGIEKIAHLNAERLLRL